MKHLSEHRAWPDNIDALARMAQNSDAWHISRCASIGGSEVAALVGYSPYVSNVMQWMLDTGREVQLPWTPQQQAAMQHGHDHEEEAAYIYACALQLTRYMRTCGLILHCAHRFIHASPDRLVYHNTTQQWSAIEIKCPQNVPQRGVFDGCDNALPIVPAQYIIQIWHQCAVLNVPFIDYVCLHCATNDTDIVRVYSNQECEACIIRHIVMHRQCVLSNRRPGSTLYRVPMPDVIFQPLMRVQHGVMTRYDNSTTPRVYGVPLTSLADGTLKNVYITQIPSSYVTIRNAEHILNPFLRRTFQHSIIQTIAEHCNAPPPPQQ